ncbi:MAG: hypothetical protein IT285_07405 [Bdellovibrionales bacterium]|nr:hypothetical protein [Bdellovibrionales bacterium]
MKLPSIAPLTHRIHRASLIPLVAAAFCLMSPPTQARDLHARLGLGFNGQFANTREQGGVPGLSLKYGLTRDIALEAIVGLNTASPRNGVTAVKLFKNLFYETNLNF